MEFEETSINCDLPYVPQNPEADNDVQMVHHIEDQNIIGNYENVDNEQEEEEMGSIKGTSDTNNSRTYMLLTCCVPECHIRFPYREGFKFRWKDERQKYFWLQALGKKGRNSNEPMWRPTKFDRICKFHFIGNRASENSNMINYIPTKIQAPSKLSLHKIHSTKKLMYKKFRMSYCWFTGWNFTTQRGDDYDKVSKLVKSCWDQEFKDCRIICKDGAAVFCHSVVLAMSSPVLKELLLPQAAEENKVIMLPQFSVGVVSAYIHHCYCLDTVPEPGNQWKEIQNLMSILRVNEVELQCDSKKSYSSAIKHAKAKVRKELSPPRPEYELSSEPEIILVSHSMVGDCCPDECRKPQRVIHVDRNPIDPMCKELTACKEFVEQEIAAHPNWITEKTVKSGFVLNNKGSVSYEEISSSITFKTQKVVVQKVSHQVADEKTFGQFPISHDHVKQELIEEDVNNATQDHIPEAKEKARVLKTPRNEDFPCTFDCSTCNAKIKTTIPQHNLLVSKVNGEMRAGSKKVVGVIYQCQKCQKNGNKITKEHSEKSWGFVRPANEPGTVQTIFTENDEDEDSTVLCSNCGIQCKNSQFLEWHMNEHEGIKPYSCKECNISYHNPLSLRNHNNMMHSTVLKGKCSLCDEIIVCRKGKVLDKLLENHKKNHHSGN